MLFPRVFGGWTAEIISADAEMIARNLPEALHGRERGFFSCNRLPVRKMSLIAQAAGLDAR